MMGNVRRFTKRKRWTDAEVSALIDHYEKVSRLELSKMFPDRDIRTVESKANMLGLRRPRRRKRTQEEVREAKRLHMARKRRNDPDAARAYDREYHNRNKERNNAKYREWFAKHFFCGRANRYKGITAKALASLWRMQRGRCALTGDKLDRSAELDHKIPKARGGTDDIENFRWVTKMANRAKRELLDHEFTEL